MGTLRFVALKDTTTYISVVDSPSVNRRTAVIEKGSGNVISPYLVPGRYALSIRGLKLRGWLRLQGRDGGGSVRLRVDLRRSNGAAIPDSVYRPTNDLDQNSANGIQLDYRAAERFSLLQVPAGSYTLFVKSYHYLRGKVTGDSVKVSSSSVPEARFYWRSSTGRVWADTLRGGDANDDNRVNLADFGLLAAHFGASSVKAGQPAWRADFNGDAAVDLGDFGVLASNFGESGMGQNVAFKPANGPDIFALTPLEEGTYALVLTEPFPLAGFSAEVFAPPDSGLVEARVQPGAGLAQSGFQSQWIERELEPGHIRIAAHVWQTDVPMGGEVARITTGGPPPVLEGLRAIDLDGRIYSVGLSDRFSSDLIPVPAYPALYQNIPNPFNPSTAIRYDVADQADVSLSVYNLLGQEIRTLVQDRQTPGSYSIVWDGIDRSGRPVASGIYLYRLSIGSFRDVKKLLVLR